MNSRLRDYLARTRNPDGGWPYLAGRQSRLEATAWAMLALGDQAAARLLLGWRGRNGLILEPSVNALQHSFNAIAALALASSDVGLADEGASIACALLGRKGIQMKDHPAIKQDSSLQGWAWSEGSFSWAEPTAWCLLAVKKLCREQSMARARIDEAEQLLRDRMCAGGGWNYGNKEVYGKSLLPHVPPTAAGVLAFQDRRTEPFVKSAIGVLEKQGPREGSAAALAVTWLALAAIQAPPSALAAQLSKRVEPAEAVGNVAVIGMLLYVLELTEKTARPTAFMLS